MSKYLLGILLCLGFTLNAQQLRKQPKISYDSVHVKADRFIFYQDNAYYTHIDTIYVLPDTVEFHIRKNNMDKTDNFYLQVKNKMSKRSVSNLMYQYLFKSRSNDIPHNEESSRQRFFPYENENIVNIRYKSLKVFGSDINDTTIVRPSNWYKFFNKFHVHTRKWVVRKNLIFTKGDPIIAEDLVDNERLLRRLNFIQDARIYVEDKESSDDVKVIVTSKDVFPYNFLINPNNDNGARFGISNINIAGTGHELEYDNIVDNGSDFYYRIRSIQGLFIDSELNYADYFRKKGYGLFLTKDFLTQETKYAGGVSYSKYEFAEVDFNPITDVTNFIAYDLAYKELWVGKAFETSLVSNVLGLREHTKAVFSAKIDGFRYTNAPAVDQFTNFRFHDRTNFLLSLGLTSRVYYKDKYILQFGRTEDIPTGSTFGLVTGYQKAQFNNRFYAGVNFARGGYIPKFGYLNGIFSLGSFFSENKINDGVVKLGVDYFTKLYSFNQFKFRQFVEMNVAHAINPSEEIALNSQNDLGIRGISDYYLRATTKFNVKFESLLFTPLDVLGFNMALLAFVDLTTTTNDKNPLINNNTFYGFGGGIRLRNDNLAISTIQLRLGYYPNVPINGSTNLLNVVTSTSLNIRDFAFREPEIISFN